MYSRTESHKTEQRSQLRVVHMPDMRTDFPLHFHGCYVFSVVAGASGGAVYCNGRRHELSRGTGLIFSPGVVHACAGKGTLDFYTLHISVHSMNEIAARRGIDAMLHGLASPVLSARDAEHLLHALTQRNEQDRAAQFEEFLKAVSHSGAAQHEEGAPRSVTEQACRLIDAEYATPLSVPQVAQRCGVSASTLLRCFVRDCGITPHAYLLNVRIDHARQLLSDGCAPTESALRTGFCDQSHLTNVFRRYLGITPALYRQSVAASQNSGVAQ